MPPAKRIPGPLTDAERKKWGVGGAELTKSAREERRSIDWLLEGGRAPRAGDSAFVKRVVRGIYRDRAAAKVRRSRSLRGDGPDALKQLLRW